jgi:UDP-N-acetylmuramoylalanine--D-glutamate ligase
MNPNDPLHALPDDPETPMALPGVGAPAEAGQAVQARAAEVFAQPEEGTVAAQDAVPASTAAPAQELPQTLHAARDAAAFVAQIFADVATPEPTTDTPATETAGAEPSGAVLAPTPVPVGWPLAGTGPLQGRNILVLGLGASGLAMARWCVRCGAQVTVADTREAPPQLPLLQQELPQVRFVAGAFGAHLVEGQGLAAVYRSPGLSPTDVASVFVAAGACGISAEGELGLYSMALRGLQAAHGYAPAVLAITGTNGKTTVTALTGRLVEHAGKTVAVAGNIGPTLLDTLAERIDAGQLPDVWVLELSSFQLDGATGFEPTAATVLNITQDHLDWHGDIAAYAAAKARIFGDAGLMVLNREDPAVMAMLPPPARPKAVAAPSGASDVSAPARVRFQKPQQRAHVTFGGDMPRRPGDFGIEVVSGMAWLVRAQEADETLKRPRRAAVPGAEGGEDELHIQRLMPADALRIRGRHNAVNALAALALAQAAGCPLGAMLYGLREYRGEPHRVESVGRLNGVEYFDDSKGTNVGATVAALTGLGAERRIVVILGGDGKGQDFAPLAPPVARYARAVVLIGRDAPLIRAALQETGVVLHDADSLPAAVQWAAGRAHAGDAVLMSPACASFDMFNNYGHRAQVFVQAVHQLALDAGQDLEGTA